MVDPVSVGLSLVIGSLMKDAPEWFRALKETLFSKGKELALAKGKEQVTGFLDEKKHLRHVELALKNAVERGLRQWHTAEDRDTYRNVLQLLSERHSAALLQEAMRLFTLSDNPSFTTLTEKYNLSERIKTLAHGATHQEVDAAPYLSSFFAALIAEFYNDPLFRDQMGNVIHVRAALKEQRSLDEIVATLLLMQNTLQQTYSPEQFQRDVATYIEHIENKFRHHKFAGIIFRGDEDKAPELDGIFVPLRTILQDQPSSTDEIDDVLLSLLEQSPYLVLLGGPGSGKSTTTRYLAWSHATANEKASSARFLPTRSAALPGKPVPLRIELRLFSEVRKQRPEYSFLSYATEVVLGREDIALSLQMFRELLERRAMLLLFDGLDEVPTLNERRQLIDEIESLAQNYPGNRILVTSRPIGYETASFTNPLFRHGRILDFNDEQIHLFLQSWYTHVLKFSSLPPDIQAELEAFYATLIQNIRLHTLATNPLLLTVMTALHRYERLPDERVLIYERCADLLLDTWARLKYNEPRWKDMKLGKKDQLACLAHLGFVLHQRSQEIAASSTEEQSARENESGDTAVDVPANFMRREIKRFLATQNLLSGAEQNAEAERFLELVRIEAGLIVSRGTDEVGESLYGFVHRTFQEYFAAAHVLEQYEQEGDPSIVRAFLKEHVHDPHWSEVVLLLMGKLKHKFATLQLRKILEGKNDFSRYNDVLQQDLFFVCTCLAEGITVEQDFAVQVVTELSTLFKITPFAPQRQAVFAALGALLPTRQYAELGQKAFKTLFADDTLFAVLLQALDGSTAESAVQREGIRWLLARTQRADLTLEHLIQIAEALYYYSAIGSQEKGEGVRLLIAHTQRDGLTLEQRIQIAAALYYYSQVKSSEKQHALAMLWQLVQHQNLSIEQRLQAAIVPCTVNDDNFSDRVEAIRLVLTLVQEDEARKYIAEEWEEMPYFSQLSFFMEPSSLRLQEASRYVSDAASIFELCKQAILPPTTRDNMYQLLRDMLPLLRSAEAGMSNKPRHGLGAA